MAETNSIRLTRDYLYSLCSVKSMSGELLATGRISDVTPDYVELMDPEDRLPLVPYNTTVHISIFNEKLPSYFGVGRAYISTDDLLRIVEYADINNYERRSAFRVRVKLKGKLWLLGDDLTDREKGLVLPIEVKNLSLTGLFFQVKRELVIGQKVRVMVTLPWDYFQFECRVRRVLTREREVGYGCSFEELSRPMADKLCAYLFRVQGEQIRKAKGR